MRAWLHRRLPWLFPQHDLVTFEMTDLLRHKWQGVRCTRCTFVDDRAWVRLPPPLVDTRSGMAVVRFHD